MVIFPLHFANIIWISEAILIMVSHGLATESRSSSATLLHGLIYCVSQFIIARLLPVPGLGGLEVI